MLMRLTWTVLFAASLLLTHASCAGGRSRQASGALPQAKAKSVSSKNKQQRPVIAVGEDIVFIKRGNRAAVAVRGDDNGDGVPDGD